MSWREIDLSSIDTPALLVDKGLVSHNITAAIDYAGGVDHFRPHVKTHKTLEVAELQLAAGITRYKCATIPEAEMLGMAEAPDVLIAYQPHGPKIHRVASLIKTYPSTTYSVLIDHPQVATAVQEVMEAHDIALDIYIDVDNGNHRTGIPTRHVDELIDHIKTLSHLRVRGLHCYDGHIRMSDITTRTTSVNEARQEVLQLRADLSSSLGYKLDLVMGGSPSFSIHKDHSDVTSSPGTWIFWDARYADDYPEQPFAKAAILATRVISKLDSHTYCLDLGHKSVASEMPYPRVEFLDGESISQTGHSEEHMVVQVEAADSLEIGEVLLAYPYHICPTVALYDAYHVVEDGQIIDMWKVIARDRMITI